MVTNGPAPVVPEVHAPSRRLIVAMLGVAGLLAAVYLYLPTGGLAQTAVLVLAAFTAAALLVTRLAREGLLGTWPWTFLAAGSGLYGVATTFWGLVPIITGRQLPFPSPVDAAYFGSYGLSAVFLVGLLHRRYRDSSVAPRAATLALLDAGSLAVATVAIFWPMLIGPNLTDPDLAGMAQLVAVGYPLLTAILVGLVARLVLSGRTRTSAEWLLVVWAGGELAGDIFYGYLSATGDFFHGHPISLAWLVSYVALGALALHPGLIRLTEVDASTVVHGPRFWLPMGAVLLPLSVTLFGHSVLLHVVTTAGVLLVITRMRLVSGDLAQQRRLATELVVLTDLLEHRSRHDELTGLANRSEFSRHLDQAWADRQRHGRGLIVLAIDLDGFKAINDRHGHHAGDHVLVEVAQRMQRCVRESDTLARVGGDEFAVVLPEATLTDARAIAERIAGELASPLVVGDEPRIMAASVGIAEADERQAEPSDLLREADTAMYAAKAAGKARYESYRPGLERASHLTLSDVVAADAIAWADYMRRLRLEIADRKQTGDVFSKTRAPAGIHRTLEQVLAAIDRLSEEATSATLVLPPQQDLEEFVFHQTAVQHWADALVAQARLTVQRTPEAGDFWHHLQHQVVPLPAE